MAKGIGPVKLTRADQKILKSYIPTLQGLAAYLAVSYTHLTLPTNSRV